MFAVQVFAADKQEDAVHVTKSEPVLQTDFHMQPEDVISEEPLTDQMADTHTLASAVAGYRFLSTRGYGGRAAPYEYIHSGPTFGGMYNRLNKDFKFSLEGNYLNDKDYHGDLLSDYRGEYRFHLRTESLFHNLDHEPLGPNFSFGGALYNANEQDPGGRYGVRTEQDQASFRYKLHDYPLHINLDYWRLLKEGTEQLLFANTVFEYFDPNTIFSKTRTVDQQTHQGSLGFDVHLGMVDLIYNFKIREFNNHAATPRDSFSPHNSPYDQAGFPVPGGLREHNAYPDSRFYDHTVKLHTSLSGGIVGAASYTYGKRENRTSLNDLRGADQNRDTLQNAAGDVVYTPCKEFSLAIKYRRQEVDRDNPATLFSVPDSSVISVRPSLSTQRDTITAGVSVRAANTFTVKGEYRGDFLHRDNVAFWNMPIANVTQNLPENTTSHQGTVSILSRPLKGLRIKAQYSYSATGNPSYGTSFGNKHDGQLLVTYNSLNRWGATANYRVTRESNDQIVRSTLPGTIVITPNTLNLFVVDNPISRGRDTDAATASGWFSPLDKLTISGSYAFLRTRVDQGVLFEGVTTVPTSSFGPTSYTSQAQVYSINTVYSINGLLDLSLFLQQIRSYSDFAPQFKDFGQNRSTADIENISHSKAVESSLSARVDYHLTKDLACTVDYSYRDYDEKFQGLYNGTVQAVMAYVSGKW